MLTLPTEVRDEVKGWEVDRDERAIGKRTERKCEIESGASFQSPPDWIFYIFLVFSILNRE